MASRARRATINSTHTHKALLAGGKVGWYRTAQGATAAHKAAVAKAARIETGRIHFGKTGIVHTFWQTGAETAASVNRQIKAERDAIPPFVPGFIVRKARDQNREGGRH